MLATSVSTWLEPSHLGDVLTRMAAAFAEAQSNAPCLLFIDEIDGIGRRRDDRGEFGDYWNAVVNRALELMDGALRTEGVILIGATNRPSAIDAALLRSGRLETRIDIPMPDIDALVGILDHHLGALSTLSSPVPETTRRPKASKSCQALAPCAHLNVQRRDFAALPQRQCHARDCLRGCLGKQGCMGGRSVGSRESQSVFDLGDTGEDRERTEYEMTSNPAESKRVAGTDGEKAAILRSLARRTVGFSGADVERLVREARQRARRDRRNVTYADFEALIAATRPPMSPEMRRRVAVHEAGHALVRILLGIGEITLITVEAAGGEAFTELLATNDIMETAEACQDYIVALMAGRAAEQVVFGSALAGSGGAIRSDLAQATRLATMAETSLGFGSRQPLVYRDPDHWQILLRQDARLAKRVQSRLAKAERSARRMVRQCRYRLDLIVDESVAKGTLEGADLARLI